MVTFSRHLRRAAPGEPGRGRALVAEGPLARRRGRVREALPGGRRPLRPLAAGGGRGGAFAHRRVPGHRAVAELDPVQQQHPVPDERPAVPPQRGLLRVHTPVRAVPRPLGAGGPDRGAARHPAQPLPQRRHPDAGPAPAGAPLGQGPPLGHPGPDRPGQGRRLLPRPLQPGPLLQRLRAGCRLHRRARPAPRPRPADPGVAGRRRTAHLQHPPPGLGAPDPRGGPLVPGGPDRRDHLPGGGPGAQGQPGPEHARAPVHPAQHRGHPGGHGRSTT